jgi:hypothetical protein
MHLGSAAIHHGYLIRALGMVMPGRAANAACNGPEPQSYGT